MKRIALSLLLLVAAFSAKAMSYEEARQQAWFLTDKMAYELNLTSEQYDRAYQINLDYLMSVDTPSDCSGYYWQYRDADFRCVLFDWQYNLYRTLDYFFRPVRWVQSRWYYPVFDHYRYGYYYFDYPTVYATYRGGMWRRRGHNDPSPYIAAVPARGFGMRDQYRNRNWTGGHNEPPRGNAMQPGGRGQGGFSPFGPQGGNNRGQRGGARGNGPAVQPDNNRTQPNNNRTQPGNNRTQPGNNTKPFADPYTNYRQTGQSNSTGNRGGSQSGQRGGGNLSGRGTGSFIQAGGAAQSRGQNRQATQSAPTGTRGGRAHGGR